MGFNTMDKINRVAIIGYWIDADHSGKGILTNTAREFIDDGFKKYGFNRIELRAGTENTRSCAVAERLGFTYEGVLREIEWLNDRFVSHKLYSMLASDWNSKRAHERNEPATTAQ
jgi:ribosomal-protein-serine acetyltransferase